MGRARKNRTTDLAKSGHQNHIQVASYSGPLPPPQVLQGYEKTLPGAAERIISMAEKQAQHRQSLESLAIRSGSRDSILGLIFGFLLGLVGIVAGTACILKGFQVSGSVVGAGSLVSLVGVFVYGSSQRRKEREEKNKLLR